MKLSDSELRFVKKWQRNERWWPRTRWFCLVSGVALTVTWALILHQLLSLPLKSYEDAAGMAWLSPICWIFLFISSGWIGLTLAHWRGDMKTKLLLRLIKENEQENA